MLVLMASAFSAVLPSSHLLKVDQSPVNHHPLEPRRRQQRIAEITEMIHVASLLHDDVIDNAETRRGLKALNSAMGNKIAILAGDFLLARASVSLASLRNTEVIELLSQVIEHLVSGEILQVRHIGQFQQLHWSHGSWPVALFAGASKTFVFCHR